MIRVIVRNYAPTRDAGSRANYQGKGTHAYNESDVEVVCMGDDRWYVFYKKRDLGVDFATLRAGRRWVVSPEGRAAISAAAAGR